MNLANITYLISNSTQTEAPQKKIDIRGNAAIFGKGASPSALEARMGAKTKDGSKIFQMYLTVKSVHYNNSTGNIHLKTRITLPGKSTVTRHMTLEQYQKLIASKREEMAKFLEDNKGNTRNQFDSAPTAKAIQTMIDQVPKPENYAFKIEGKFRKAMSACDHNGRKSGKRVVQRHEFVPKGIDAQGNVSGRWITSTKQGGKWIEEDADQELQKYAPSDLSRIYRNIVNNGIGRSLKVQSQGSFYDKKTSELNKAHDQNRYELATNIQINRPNLSNQFRQMGQLFADKPSLN